MMLRQIDVQVPQCMCQITGSIHGVVYEVNWTFAVELIFSEDANNCLFICIGDGSGSLTKY